ncbi:MAG TPA: hypothetical protein PLJ39_10590 [Spirochaetota bacterium]|nr:hypothetical protein [Spirochaetota bacterium]
MKKKILIAAAVLASASILAQDAPKEEVKNPFKFSGQAYAYGALYKTAVKDQSSSYGAYRFRPYFSYLTDNVEATVKLEIDQVLGGSKNNSKYSVDITDGKVSGNGQQADVGNDEKAIEVKSAFLKFKVPTIAGLTVKGGVDEYKTVGGFTCGTEVGHGLINYKADMFDLSLIMAKVWEPNTLDTKDDDTTEKNDVTFYGADATLKLNDDIKIRPALYLIQAEKNQNPADSKVAFVGKTAMIPSMGANMKLGDISVDFAGAYGKCAKDENGIKYSGYALDLASAYKVSSEMLIGGFFTLLSGDDGSSATEKKAFSNFMLKADGWGRMYLLENMQLFSNFQDPSLTDIRGKSNGYMLAGAFVSYKISEIEVKVQGAWGRLNKVESGAKKDLGVELDGQLSYEVEKNAKLVFECAYLATGKAFGEDGAINKDYKNQKALYSALGMSYKW